MCDIHFTPFQYTNFIMPNVPSLPFPLLLYYKFLSLGKFNLDNAYICMCDVAKIQIEHGIVQEKVHCIT